MNEELFKENVTVGKWQNLDNYNCNLCPYAILDKNAMMAHLIAKHFPPEPAQPVLVQAYDRWGKETGPSPGESHEEEEETVVVDVSPETTIEEVLEKVEEVKAEEAEAKAKKKPAAKRSTKKK